MKLQIPYNRNPHQAEFHADLTTKLLHLSSGFGGGKTFGLVMKLLQLSAINKYCDGGLLCPTYGDFKKDVLPIFEDIFENANIKNWNYHKGDHYFTLPWTKRKLWVATAENKLRGPNWGYAGINEVTLIPLVRYREVLGRVRDKRSSISQIASVGTPEGTQSEYHDFFIENPPDDPRMSVRIIYGDTRDNAENLDPAYIAMLETAYDKVMIDAYLRGLWVNMTGNQFYYAYDPAKNHDKTITEIPSAIVHCALDFNVDYMTATLWHLFDNKLYGFNEIVLPSNADTQKMANALKARGYTPDRTIIYPDPAGQARSTKGQPDHTILKNAGFEIKARSAQPRFRQRQLNVNNLLDKATITFNPDTMPTLKKDLEGVEQDTVTLEKVKDNPKLTHASDGLDYLCDILFEFSGKKPQAKIMRVR